MINQKITYVKTTVKALADGLYTLMTKYSTLIPQALLLSVALLLALAMHGTANGVPIDNSFRT